MLRELVLILSLMIVADGGAWAQNRPPSYPGTPQEQKACRGDAERFCRGMTDASEVRACLVSHRREIAARCRRVLERHGY
jgi:hypothetical protein